MKQSYEWLLAASLSVILSIVSNLQQIRRACSVNRCIGVCGGQQIIARSLCVDSNPIRHLTQGFRSLLQQDVSRRVICVCRLLSGRKVIIKLISSFSLKIMRRICWLLHETWETNVILKSAKKARPSGVQIKRCQWFGISAIAFSSQIRLKMMSMEPVQRLPTVTHNQLPWSTSSTGDSAE